ncbi:exodeoxyribonuclease V subunit gamma [Motilimonas cestriensis]|uniref:exodeoxyribonuclease V subunit gamma n=1 Tax=Motilimonas cestriensis TaxID=2742685 RepID=UPI003DA3E3D7
MFKLYHSNRLDFLKEILAHLIQSEPLEHPFTAEQILVQSPGMAQWLKLELAKKTGIAANIDFPLPASFIWQMFKLVLAGVPEKSPYNKESMAWALMTLLPSYLEHPAFAPLKIYLDNDESSLKRYQLCHKIADIYDQYLVYRPEWINAWEAGLAGPEWEEQQAWQPILWQALHQKINQEFNTDNGVKPYHRAGLYADLISQLQQHNEVAGLPKRLFVFGISAMAPEYLKALLALGQHVEVHLFLTNPCQEFWDDIVDAKYLARLRQRQRTELSLQDNQLVIQGSNALVPAGFELDPDMGYQLGNPLLASMGKLGRDFLYQLHSLQVDDYGHFIEPAADNLLAWVQSDILSLHNATAQPHRTVAPDDNSLALVGCHSAMREVEVLHDHLLSLLQQDPELTPKDIIVMMPDVNAYSPYIQAVFGSAAHATHIPFSISDRSACQENPILTSFIQLLRLPLSRCTSSELLELLAVPAVLAKFEISQGEFEQIRQWVIESGVRWGLDHRDGEKFSLPELPQNTWLFGLQRMLLGYAMDQQMFQGILPYTECQGLAAAPLGKLCQFVNQLIELSRELQQHNKVEQWKHILFALLDDFYQVDDADFEALMLIKEQLNQLHQQVDASGFDETLSLAIISDYLQQKLNLSSGGQRFLAGQVNFCTLMPMRSIPFKVVCLLGMNDGAYPRSIPPLGFDLMAERMEKGDRSRRDDDRYLFLEALCSAQQHLYISYISRSIKDNTERTPSVLVSELLDYCEQGFQYESDDWRKQLMTEYPLQPFSPRYFNGDYTTFAQQWWFDGERQQKLSFVEVENGKVLSQILPTADAELSQPIELDLQQLIRFFRHPCQSFMNQTLKVWLPLEEGGQFDHEPFSLNGLDNYLLGNQILIKQLASQDTHALFEEVQAQGVLPQGQFGLMAFQRQVGEVKMLAQQLQPLLEHKQEDLACELRCVSRYEEGGIDIRVNLVGWLKNHYGTGLVSFKAGGLNGKDLLQHWILHLAYCAMGYSARASYLLGKVQGVAFNSLEQEYAKQKLTELVGLYLKGQTQPLPLFPNSAYEWAAKICEKEPTHIVQNSFDDALAMKAKEQALKRFEGNFVAQGEGQDPYIARCYQDLNLVWDDFTANSAVLFGPLMANISPFEP